MASRVSLIAAVSSHLGTRYRAVREITPKAAVINSSIGKETLGGVLAG